MTTRQTITLTTLAVLAIEAAALAGTLAYAVDKALY